MIKFPIVISLTLIKVTLKKQCNLVETQINVLYILLEFEND